MEMLQEGRRGIKIYQCYLHDIRTSRASPSLHICQVDMTDSTIKDLALRWPRVHKYQLSPVVEMSLEMGNEFGEGPWVWRRALGLETGHDLGDRLWVWGRVIRMWRRAMSLETGHEFGDAPSKKIEHIPDIDGHIPLPGFCSFWFPGRKECDWEQQLSLPYTRIHLGLLSVIWG